MNFQSTNLTGCAARTCIPRMFHPRQLLSRPRLLSETSAVLENEGNSPPPHPVTSINSKALQWPQQSGFISDLTLAHILVCLSLKYKYTLLVKKIQLKFGQPKSPCQQVKKKKLQQPGITLEVQWAAQALHKTELDRNARLWPWIFTSLADGTVHTAQASGNGCS